jgi:3-carboxy-cis,cis-muconate cycloisomerase
MARVCIALAKMGEDLTALTQTGISEVQLGAAGASSTMPQKQNPVAPSALAALSAQVQGQLGVLQTNSSHRYQRDGAAWFAEWTALPQIVLGTAAALETARQIVPNIMPNPNRMAEALSSQFDMIHAEALSFALARDMPRPEAQAATKALCREAAETQTALADLVRRDFPNLEADGLFDPAQQMGHAPDDARRFATAARSAQS